MVQHPQGLTETYDRFHDPGENDPSILTLRDLHDSMDRAILDSHGWTDIPADCEFLLDDEVDEEDWDTKKKPWRYRWPDDVGDEVLARPLDLNTERAPEEKRFGAAASSRRTPPTGRSRPREPEDAGLFS